MPPEAWTILKLLNWTTAYLQSHDIEQPRTAAEILLAYTLGVDRVDLYTQYDCPLEARELAIFKNLVRRRLHREPVAYIVGEKGFWSLDLKVTRDVLIPRPETETLVEAALCVIPQEALPRPYAILDLGTGSGAVILALAKERAGHRFYGVDSCRKALAVAQHNARRHGLDRSVMFLQGSWFDALRDEDNRFHIIVSNPPYIPRGDLKMLPAEISQYEPRQALDGGCNGLDAIRIVVENAMGYMAPGGWLFFEIAYNQSASVKKIVEATQAYNDVTVIKDYSGFDRVVRARVEKKAF